MPVPTEDLVGCRAAHARLLAGIAGLTEADARRASLLPSWTVGHVLTHIARNADSVVRRLDGAGRGEIVAQYDGGMAGRAAAIEAGAARPAAALVADVQASADAVDAACATCPPEVWELRTRGVGGEEQPAWAMVFARWREVEVHHADLGLGFTPQDWSPDLVARWLVQVLPTLAERGDQAALLAWAVGRGQAPELAPWP